MKERTYKWLFFGITGAALGTMYLLDKLNQEEPKSVPKRKNEWDNFMESIKEEVRSEKFQSMMQQINAQRAFNLIKNTEKYKVDYSKTISKDSTIEVLTLKDDNDNVIAVVEKEEMGTILKIKMGEEIIKDLFKNQ